MRCVRDRSSFRTIIFHSPAWPKKYMSRLLTEMTKTTLTFPSRIAMLFPFCSFHCATKRKWKKWQWQIFGSSWSVHAAVCASGTKDAFREIEQRKQADKVAIISDLIGERERGDSLLPLNKQPKKVRSYFSSEQWAVERRFEFKRRKCHYDFSFRSRAIAELSLGFFLLNRRRFGAHANIGVGME